MSETLTDNVPLSTFSENTAELLHQIRTTHRPITLTVDGHPELVIHEAADYQRLLDIAALSDAREGIRQGLEQLRRGEGRPASEFFAEIRAKYGLSR